MPTEIAEAEILEGKRPSREVRKTFWLVDSLFESSYTIIRPYFLAYGLDASKPTLQLRQDPLYLNGFMAAGCSDDGEENFLDVSLPRFMGILGHRSKEDKIYGCAYFFNGVAHELVHFSQYEYSSFAGISRNESRAWVEGTAYLVSWLILSDIYRDLRSELRFSYSSVNSMAKAIREKRIKTGLARVMAYYNYCFYLVSLRSGFAYQLPEFLPRRVQELYREMVVSGGPTFSTCGMEHWAEEIEKDTFVDIAHWAKWAKGVTAAYVLLRENRASPSTLVARLFSDDEVEKIIEMRK